MNTKLLFRNANIKTNNIILARYGSPINRWKYVTNINNSNMQMRMVFMNMILTGLN
jgi:hypothetical protein